jgi:hypothetical protein
MKLTPSYLKRLHLRMRILSPAKLREQLASMAIEADPRISPLAEFLTYWWVFEGSTRIEVVRHPFAGLPGDKQQAIYTHLLHWYNPLQLPAAADVTVEWDRYNSFLQISFRT